MNAQNSLRSMFISVIYIALTLALICVVYIAGKAFMASQSPGKAVVAGQADAKVVEGERAAVLQRSSEFDKFCTRLLTDAEARGVLARSKVEELKKHDVSRIAMYVECSGVSQAYLRELDGLLKRHNNFLETKEADKKRDDATTALVSLVGFVIAVITVWLAWGVSSIDRLRGEADAILAKAKQHAELRTLGVAASKELWEVLAKHLGVETATKSLAAVSLNLELLAVNDPKLVSDAAEELSNYWMPSEGRRYPIGRRYVESLRNFQTTQNLNYLKFFD